MERGHRVRNEAQRGAQIHAAGSQVRPVCGGGVCSVTPSDVHASFMEVLCVQPGLTPYRAHAHERY